MNWRFAHCVWALAWRPRKTSLGLHALCTALLLIAWTTSPARADCPAAPLGDPDDMAISFLKTNGVQAASASLLQSSVKEGMLVYDDAADKLKICDGTNWVDVGSGSGTDTLAALSCAAGQIAKFNGTTWVCAADGGGSGGAVPTFFVHKNNVSQTVASSTWTKLTWSSETFDTNNNFASNKFQPTVAGKYIVTASAQCTNGSACSVAIFKGAGVYNYNYSAGAAPNGTTTSAILDLNGTSDFVEAWIYNAAGTTVDGGSTVTNFSGALVDGGGVDTLGSLSCAMNEIAKWNGTAWACAADGGGGGNGVTPAFRAHRNSVDQTVVSAAAATIDWTIEDFDTANNFDPATDRFTPTIAGKYLVSAGTYCPNAINYCLLHIYKNGALSIGEGYQSDNDSAPSVTALVDMNGTTDYLTVVAVNSGGTTLSGAPHLTYFSGFLTGAAGSDTLSGLSCTSGQIPKWNGTAWACASDGGGSGGGGLEYFAGSTLLVGDITYHNITPTNNYPVAVPPSTKAVKLTVYYIHGSSTTNTHGYLSFFAYQKGQTNAAKKVSYFSQHFSDYANSDIAYLDIPWDDSLDNEVTIQVTSSHNTDPLNKYAIYLAGYVVGGGSSAMAAGSASEVQFRNSGTGAFAADSAFRYDPAAHILTISPNPATLSQAPFTNTVLHLSNVDGSAPRLLMEAFSNGSTTAPNFSMRSANGTGATPLALRNEDILGQLTFTGHNGTSFATARSAIRGTATEDWTPTANGADLRFHTTPNGTADVIEAMRIANDGNIGIGTATPAYKLDVNGAINGTSVLINGVPVASSTDTYWSSGGAGKIYYSGGNVGIGTTAPISRLQVGGDSAGINNLQPAMTIIADGVNDGGTALRLRGAIMAADVLAVHGLDNTPNFVVKENGFVGIGTAAPTFPLHVATDTAAAVMSVSQAGNNTGTSILGFRKSRGTHASPSAVSVNDPAGQIDFNAYNDAFRTVAQISAYADAGFGATGADGPGRLVLSTAPDGSDMPQPRLTVLSNGNVGIGTATPQSLLQIDSPASSVLSIGTAGDNANEQTAIALITQSAATNNYLGSASVKGWSIYGRGNAFGSSQDNDFGLSFWNGTSWNSSIVAKSNGNFGIGTTNPVVKLHVADAAAPMIFDESDQIGAPGYWRFVADGGTYRIDQNTSASRNLSTYRSPLSIDSSGNVRLGGYTAGGGGSETLFVGVNGGNVGIGTSGPGDKLHIEGTPSAGIFLNTTGSGPRQAHIRFGDGGSNKWQWRFNPNDTGDRLLAYSYTLGADVLTLDASGNVGIGVTNPTRKLQVEGDVWLSDASFGGLLYLENLATWNGNFYLCYTSTPTNQHRVTKNATCNASDLRLKENIADSKYGLDSIMKLRPVEFDWKDKKNRGSDRQVGLIAQEVAKVIPEVVAKPTQEGEMYALRYEMLVTPLIKAVQELKAENDNQAAEIRELREEIDALKAARQ